MRPIVLASGSPRRRELLTQIGMEFTVIPGQKKEVMRFTRPDQIVEDLSLQKAQDIAEQVETGTIVIGSDTVVAVWTERSLASLILRKRQRRCCGKSRAAAIRYIPELL